METLVHIVAVLVHISTGQTTTLTNTNMYFNSVPECVSYTQQNTQMIGNSLYVYLESEYGPNQPWRIDGLLCGTREWIEQELGPATDDPQPTEEFLST
tara:strand:+ start:978 stop:1271 length:294 start_codon:yes stop_codon:yes gene_type:complete